MAAFEDSCELRWDLDRRTGDGGGFRFLGSPRCPPPGLQKPLSAWRAAALGGESCGAERQAGGAGVLAAGRAVGGCG